MRKNVAASPGAVLEARSISKKYGAQRLFRDITVSLTEGQSLAVTGHNGSGKSTFLRILAGIQRPDTGTISISINEKKIQGANRFGHLGMMGPLVIPYRDLTGRENIQFAARSENDRMALEELMEKFNLAPHADKPVKSYSTGMIQRLKFCLALAGDPVFLFLDEPGSNLDDSGREKLYDLIGSMRNKIIVIATNDSNEAAICGRELRIGQ